MMNAKIIMVENTLMPRLMALDTAIVKGVQATLLRYEPIAEARVKERAPWTDRTGNARNGLAAKAILGGETEQLVIYHQVPYGIYLETKNGGKYRVIMPVVNEIGKDIMKTLGKMFSALGAGRVTRL
jgi:hypothetical protein